MFKWFKRQKRAARVGVLVTLALVVTTAVVFAASYPTAIDSFCNPSPGDKLSALCGTTAHSLLHTQENTAIIALETKLGIGAATPQANGFLGDCGLGGGATKFCTPVPPTPVNTSTPAPTATTTSGSCTGYPCGGGLSSVTTVGVGNVTMTNANTDYTAVTYGSSLVNGQSYQISAYVQVHELNATAGNLVCLLYDSTNSTSIHGAEVFAIYPASLSGDYISLVQSPVIYSGFSGTPTIIFKCQSTNTGDVLNTGSGGITVLRVT